MGPFYRLLALSVGISKADLEKMCECIAESARIMFHRHSPLQFPKFDSRSWQILPFYLGKNVLPNKLVQ